MLIIAHRGASAEAPENTMEAFDLAYAEGAGGLEFDVRLAACGTPVIIHDETLERTTNGKGRVSDHDATALKALGVPSLQEVLECCAGRGVLFIEIKAPDAALPAARLLEAAIREGAWRREQLVSISFDHACLLAAKETYPGLVLGLSLTETREEYDTLPTIWLPMRHDLITEQEIEKARKAETPIIAWTVNVSQEARRLQSLGVAAIMTDQPEEMRKQLYG